MKRIPRKLPFVKADLRLPVAVRKVRCNSISGVQAKVLLALEDGEFRLVESGGDFILKPVPQDSESRFAADIPANEHLTMRIAHEDFMTPEFASLGYFTAPDFVALGRCYGLGESEVLDMVRLFKGKVGQVESLVAGSLLSPDAKVEYLRIFHDRLNMFRGVK